MPKVTRRTILSLISVDGDHARVEFFFFFGGGSGEGGESEGPEGILG